MASDNGKSFLDKFAEVSAKVGNQVHLRSLRDAFATITPLYILAGIAVLINNVVFPLFPLDAAGLANLQTWGSAITLGTLNVSAIILAGLIGYSLAKNERFDNPLACVVVAISAFVIMMPPRLPPRVRCSPTRLPLPRSRAPFRLPTPVPTVCLRLSSSPCSPSRSSLRFPASRSLRSSWARVCLPRSPTPLTS